MKDLSRPEAGKAAKAKDRPDAAVSPARLAAFQILRRVDEGAYASILLASQAEDLKPVDRALCHELVMGVLRRQLWLDRLIEHYSNRRVASLDQGVAISLRLGLYQLRFLTRVPAAAAVNESVKLVRQARLRSAESFVNAVLRRATREPDVDPAANSTGLSRVAIETSHPEWLIQRWIDAFGEKEAEAFAAANNLAPPVAFRIVHSADESDVLERLRDAGATLTPSRIARGAWLTTTGGSFLHELSQSGHIYIQDEASQLVPQIFDAQPGERVLDVCSAPGGKTTQIAGTSDDIRVIAGDVHEHRLRTVRGAAGLQRIQNIHCVLLDAERPLPFPAGSFDRVLVDAPCSGTGTLRHNPEIRWRISAEGIRVLGSGQKRILLNASQMVRPGGHLVYSTCSVEPEENEAVISAFLRQDDSFAPIKLSGNPDLLTPEGHIRTWPHRDEVDGFFIAAFERKRSK